MPRAALDVAQTGEVQMKKLGKGLLCAGLCAACLVPVRGEAAYRSGADTGVEVLDYIENERRSRRENQLTEDQLRLMEDAKEMRANLRQPLSTDANAPLPVAIEGDDLFYDQRTGDVYAKGAVKITELDAKRFTTDEARGNLKQQEVSIDGKGRIVSVTPGEPPLYMDGYKIVYNYGKKTGRLENVSGKVGGLHIAGRRIELYPERVLVFDGYETKCSAEKPDYRLSGDLIEIFPEHEMIVYQAKFWVKDKILYTRDEMHVDISPGAKQKQTLPRVGYDSDNGAWISYRFSYELLPRVDAYFLFRYYSRINARNIYGLEWSNGGSRFAVESGHYEDEDNRWIRKSPNFMYSYSNRIVGGPFRYTLSLNRGKWKYRDFESIHTEYEAYFSRDALEFLPTWKLLAGIGYNVTYEGLNHSRIDGLRGDATIIHDMGPDWTAYVGYHYNRKTSQNSLFDYDLDSYPHKLNFGVSWAFTERDRFLFGQAFDARAHKQKEIDYFWFHNMHCAELILRYRAHRKTWHVSLQFAPW